MADTAKYAIVTPYYKEERPLIERCMASVRSQTVPTDHFLVADGFPQEWIDTAGVRHFKLDRSHGDYGNTPRGVGALLAIAAQYSGIAFLDADNWLEPDHVETCLAAASGTPAPCDYVIAQRSFRRPDESIMPVADEELHVDTNCFFFLPGAFSVDPPLGHDAKTNGARRRSRLLLDASCAGVGRSPRRQTHGQLREPMGRSLPGFRRDTAARRQAPYRPARADGVAPVAPAQGQRDCRSPDGVHLNGRASHGPRRPRRQAEAMRRPPPPSGARDSVLRIRSQVQALPRRLRLDRLEFQGPDPQGLNHRAFRQNTMTPRATAPVVSSRKPSLISSKA